MRALGGKLRIRLAEATVLVALAHAVVFTNPLDTDFPPKYGGKQRKESEEDFKTRMDAAKELVKQAYFEHPSYDNLIPVMYAHPLEELPDRISIQPGIPMYVLFVFCRPFSWWVASLSFLLAFYLLAQDYGCVRKDSTPKVGAVPSSSSANIKFRRSSLRGCLLMMFDCWKTPFDSGGTHPSTKCSIPVRI